MTSYVLRHERCPDCAKLGNDRSGDNLAVYSDGHTYCFRCGFHSNRTRISEPIKRNEKTVVLPADITTELPYEARVWLGRYSLSRLDLTSNNVMYSPSLQRIVFPYFDQTGLLAWQGRYVGTEDKAKWWSQGKIHEIIHPININNGEAVLVEDIISAIKVSKIKGAIPIFGSSISAKHFLRLKQVVGRVWLWLDPDMRSKSVKMASLANLLGLEAIVVFSDKDPKDYTHEEIKTFLKVDS